ncbi:MULTISPECIES: STAS domain-containing protein [unclassified Nocardia]|uniref:STAS domain-containing protein n=1 Tax=unclassified Nocardia TaxID=2637762 RepID=UPI001CE3E2AF|nr:MULTISPECIES: STAS domain-containing protein [unclassified Nocardia]
MSAIAVLQRRVEEWRENAHPPDDRPRAQREDRRRHCAIVQIEGELDATAVAEFRDALHEAVLASAHVVVVDLRRARFLSIGCAAELAAAREPALRAGVDLRVVAGRSEIERVLAVTGLRRQFEYYPTLQVAAES